MPRADSVVSSNVEQNMGLPQHVTVTTVTLVRGNKQHGNRLPSSLRVLSLVGDGVTCTHFCLVSATKNNATVVRITFSIPVMTKFPASTMASTTRTYF